MTKKHLEALAAALNSSKPKKGVRLEQWEKDCKVVANACQRYNPLFKRNKFLSACNGNTP